MKISLRISPGPSSMCDVRTAFPFAFRDRAYDAEHIRRALRARHIWPLLAMRNREHGSGLGRWALGRGTRLRMAEIGFAACACVTRKGQI